MDFMWWGLNPEHSKYSHACGLRNPLHPDPRRDSYDIGYQQKCLYKTIKNMNCILFTNLPNSGTRPTLQELVRL